MFDFRATALSGLGALVFSMALVGAAIAPARLVETAPLVYAGSAPLVEGAGHV